jgi:putative endonuclease
MDVHFVYVLECEHGAYYVGVAKSVPDRVAEHRAGVGSTWCRIHPPRRVEREIAFASRASALEGEDVELKRMMLRHGVDAVRGGSYVCPNLTREQRAALDGEIAHREGRCLRCGRRTHVARDCFARAHANGYALSAPEGSRSPNRRSVVPKCARCRRGSHVSRDCFATFSIDGERLGERRANAESSSSSEYESAEETFMM